MSTVPSLLNSVRPLAVRPSPSNTSASSPFLIRRPKAIIDDILEGMKDSDTPMQVIVDRPEAIHWALAHAQKDDIIVLMGKGHETYQEVNHVKHHMDEREIVADFFNK